MGRPSSLEKSKKEIANYFEEFDQKVFSERELKDLFMKNLDQWKISKYLKYSNFLEFLLKEELFVCDKIGFASEKGRVHTIYSSPGTSVYEKVCGLNEKAYLSYFSASYLYSLTEQIPKDIYVCMPSQVSKHIDLTQEDIFESMTKDYKKNNNFGKLGDTLVHSIFGIKMDNIVISVDHPIYGKVRLPLPEKHLIDLAIRPELSGGVEEVIKAYAESRSLVSVNVVRKLIKDFNFSYPYHQIIGFYMDISGKYTEPELKKIEKLGINFIMPLHKGISPDSDNVAIDERWKVLFDKRHDFLNEF